MAKARSAGNRLSFRGPGGLQVPHVSRRQMLEIDDIAVEESTPSLLQMMENAGRSMAELVVRHLEDGGTPARDGESPWSEGAFATGDHPGREGRFNVRVLVLAGHGGNGGGGICAARHLSSRVQRLELCLVKPHHLSAAPTAQLAIFRATDGKEVGLEDLHPPSVYDAVVDAVIGYSLSGAPSGPAEAAIRWMARFRGPIFALDLPSGVDADSGEAPGVHVSAQATLTLHLPKPGLANPAAGELWVADLGIPAEVTLRAGVQPAVYGPGFVAKLERA